MLYFAYNSIFASMAVGVEWQTYASNRKGLRVSASPEGDQRSSYFLSLPYRFGVPLMVIAAMLHWLVSQAINLINIEMYSWDEKSSAYLKSDMGSSTSGSIITCAYSPMAIFFLVAAAVALVFGLVIVGRQRFYCKLPVASSNNFLIAAACHPPREEVEAGGAALQKLQWGTMERRDDKIGHCSFSSRNVFEPRIGGDYI